MWLKCFRGDEARKRLYVVLREQSSKRTTESQRSGDHAGGVPPVPISNTEVKTSRADNTWGAGPWESRSSPGEQAIDCQFGSLSMFHERNEINER